jgi:cob(I)alamin adenosyltransferase
MVSKKTPPLSISTKTGDSGQTGLANGQRVAKTNPVIEVLGELDELNSWLGLVVIEMKEWLIEKHRRQPAKTKELPLALACSQWFTEKAESSFILEVQEQLFILGALVSLSSKVKESEVMLKKLEKREKQLEELLAESWHQNFVYPGGSRLAARIDLARSVCRRVERRWLVAGVAFPSALKFLNRLSDYLYLLRCAANHADSTHEHFFIRKKV